MTVYYVDAKVGDDKAAGAGSAPFRTPDRALLAMSAGDTAVLRGRLDDPASWFTKPFKITTPGTTWTADEGHTPTFHGGYEPVAGKKDSYRMHGRPGGYTKEMLGISAVDVTVSGLRIQHSGGEGIAVNPGAHRARVLGCSVYMTYGNGLIVAGSDKERVRDVEISNCEISYCSQGWFAVGNRNTGCGVMLRSCENVRMHHCTVHHVMKEGINIDRNGLGTVVEKCTVHTINHVAIYIIRTQAARVINNVVYHTKEVEYLGESLKKGTAPAGIVIGDESNLDGGGGQMDKHWNSGNQVVTGNVVIGMGRCFQVRNNNVQYMTQLKNAYIGNNTFIGATWEVGGAAGKTTEVMAIAENTLGPGAHVDSVIENNLFYAPPGVSLGKVAGVGGVTFRNNAWWSADGEAVPPGARGAGDVTADPQLVNPAGNDVDGYRPPAGSPLVGAGSDGATIGALTADEVTPPPPPPDVDYGWLVVELEAVKERVAGAGAAVGEALVRFDELIALLQTR